MYLFTRIGKELLFPAFVIIFSQQLIAQDVDSLRNSSDSIRVVSKIVAGPEVKGVITDAATRNPLPGITVAVPGYSAAITDDKGRYSLHVPAPTSVLVISGQLYQTKELALKGKKVVNAALYESTFNSMYGSAVMPYGPQRKSLIPYAVSAINTQGSWNSINETPDNNLQGKVAGLNVVRRSGTQGIGANLNLRGYSSLYATNQPLLIVDGMMFDTNDYGSSIISGNVRNPYGNIDLKDIESYTVIKDGASMYGTKGANGVILITTGRASTEATQIDFAAYGGYNFNVKQLPVLNSAQYRVFLSEALKNSGYSDAQIQAQAYMNDKPNPEYYKYHNNTNWQDEVIGSGYNQNYHLKVTGGDNIATYALSLGYTNNTGVIQNTGLKRYQTRFNGNLNLSSRVKAQVNVSFTTREQSLSEQGQSYKTNPLYLGLVKAPFLHKNEVAADGSVSPNLADYDVFQVSNPVAIREKMLATNNNYRFFGSGGFTYQFSKRFNFQSLLGITYDKGRENIFIPKKGVVPDTLSNSLALNASGSNVRRFYSLYTDNHLSFNQTYNKVHKLSSNLGFRFNNNDSEADFGYGYNSATDDYVTVGAGSNALRQVGGDIGKWRWLNVYGNIDYNLLDRYLVSFNVAADASSRFGKEADGGVSIGGNKMSVMPSLAAAWLVSSEPFFSGLKYIDLLKIRASYGISGNDDIGNYTAKKYYVPQNFLGMEGLVKVNIGNPKLKWERIEKMNAGVDAALLNERLSFSLDVYRNNVFDMLTLEKVSTVSGLTSVLSNRGAMKTDGFDLSLNGRILNHRDLKWDMGVTIGKYTNEVTEIPNNSKLSSYGGATFLTQVGLPANVFFGYKTDGVYTSSAEAISSGLSNQRRDGSITAFRGGDVRFVDTNNDGIIKENDRQIIGNPNPDFVGSMDNTLSYKRFSLEAIFAFSKGNSIYNGLRASLESMSSVNNQSIDVTNRWRYEGQITDVPRAELGDPAGNSRFSDRWIEDGSYLRLRTLSLIYNLPVKSGFLKYTRIYATANNVVTFTRYLGYDPEFSATGNVYNQGIDQGWEPQFRTVQLGLRIGL